MSNGDDIRGNLEIFRTDVSNYTELDDRISEISKQLEPLRKTLTELKKERISLKTGICKFMDINSINVCSIKDNGGVLKYQKRTRPVPINEQYIRKQLTNFFKSEKGRNINSFTTQEKTEMVYSYIYKENREKKYTDVLLSQKK